MKSVREKVEKEIDKIIHTIEIWTRSAMKGKVTQNELYNLEQKLKKEATDKILSQLTLGEEEIVEILANAYSESNFCIPCRGLFALQASALAHKILKKEENDLENKLCAILRAYVGETGKSEGAVDVLLRLEDELLKYRRGKGKIPKNGWTEKELDAILPKKKEKIIEECNCAKNDITCPHCTEVLVYNQAIDDCKQALLSGKEGEGR